MKIKRIIGGKVIPQKKTVEVRNTSVNRIINAINRRNSKEKEIG